MRPTYAPKIAPAVQHAHDVNELTVNRVQDHPTVHDQRTRANADLRADWTQIRMIPQLIEPMEKPIRDTIGRCLARGGGDLSPKIIKLAARSSGQSQAHSADSLQALTAGTFQVVQIKFLKVTALKTFDPCRSQILQFINIMLCLIFKQVQSFDKHGFG